VFVVALVYVIADSNTMETLTWHSWMHYTVCGIVKSGLIVMILWYSNWCPGCTHISSLFV